MTSLSNREKEKYISCVKLSDKFLHSCQIYMVLLNIYKIFNKAGICVNISGKNIK